jgi:hypothetical protein
VAKKPPPKKAAAGGLGLLGALGETGLLIFDLAFGIIVGVLMLGIGVLVFLAGGGSSNPKNRGGRK